MLKRLLLAVILAVSSTACLRVSTVITLRQDGSGTMDQEMGVNPDAFAALAAMAGGRGGDASGMNDIFNEAKAREEATKLGIKFVSGAPIDTPALKGYRAKYAFDDVKALKVAAMHDVAGQSSSKGDTFDFDFVRGASSSTITIHIPQQAQASPMSRMGRMGGDPEQAKQMLAMVKPMFAGMFVDVALAVDGTIVKTNAPYVQGNRITLAQLDMDKLLASDAAWTQMQNAQTPADLKNIPGLKVTAEPTVTIEFKR